MTFTLILLIPAVGQSATEKVVAESLTFSWDQLEAFYQEAFIVGLILRRSQFFRIRYRTGGLKL
jgi:hypothetical protein